MKNQPILLCLALVLGSLQAFHAQAQPYTYSGLEGLALGAVNGQNDNASQWFAAWDVQDSDTRYAVHNESPLAFGNLATSSDGKYLNGGGGFKSMGRRLACGAGSVWDVNGHVSDPWSAGEIDQGTVWVSFLLRVNSALTTWDSARLFFNDNNTAWSIQAGTGLCIASYNNGNNWGIQLGSGGTPVALGNVHIGSNVLFVVKLELSTTPGANYAYVWMFTNPTSANLGGADLNTATAAASLTGKNTTDLRFKGIGMYLDNAENMISVDEFRFGPTYASVTPTASGPVDTPPSILTHPLGAGVMVGQPISLFASANGSPAPALQWQRYDTNLVGQTSNTLTIASAALTDSGDYTLVATNTSGTATSSVARVTVFSPLVGNVETYPQAAFATTLTGGSGDVGATNGPVFLYPGHDFIDPGTPTATPGATRYIGGTISFASTTSEWGSSAFLDLLAHDGSPGPILQLNGGSFFWRLYWDGGNFATTTLERSTTSFDFIIKLSDDAWNAAKVSLFFGTNANSATEGTPDAVTSFFNREALNPLVALQSRFYVSGWADSASLSLSNLFSSTVWTPVSAGSVVRPSLTITPLSASQIQIGWSPATPGFVLQETAALPGGWSNSVSGAANPVVVSPSSPATFYRLIQQ